MQRLGVAAILGKPVDADGSDKSVRRVTRPSVTSTPLATPSGPGPNGRRA